MDVSEAQVEFLAEAIRLAIDNVRSGRGGPFASLVVKDGRIVATGANSVTSTNDPTAHAEIMAIREACRALQSYQLDGCEIYSSCEPCPMCLGAIYWARVARVYYAATAADAAAAGFDDSYILQQIQRPIAERGIPMIEVAMDEAREPFQVWAGKADRIRY